jgi:SAM-dependent methyltransferase
MAESFGVDPERYDRARPRYPAAVIERIVAAAPGPEVLDVGCGTGIAARQLQAAGCRVLGVDVDARMAAYARRDGLEVEVAAFEDWDPAGRTFDAVVAGQTWHWVDPVAGAAKAGRILRPGGLLALFWNVFRPTPEVAEAFRPVFDRVVPDSLAARVWRTGGGDPGVFGDRTVDGIRRAGGFAEPGQWSVEWRRTSTRDEWLDEMRTGGEASRIPPDAWAELEADVGAAVDALGGRVTMPYSTVVVTTERS